METNVGWKNNEWRKILTNILTFDFDYNHNIFETLSPYYPYITNISYNTNNTNPEISITFINQTILEKFKTENYL